MRHLSPNEREIRRSRGIDLVRFLPFALPVIVILLMSFDRDLLQHCIGRQIDGSSRYVAFFRMVTALGCSPHYLTDFSHHWLAILVFFGGIAMAIPQFFWIKRHEQYWDSVREKEKFRRATKAEQKRLAKELQKTDPDDHTG